MESMYSGINSHGDPCINPQLFMLNLCILIYLLILWSIHFHRMLSCIEFYGCSVLHPQILFENTCVGETEREREREGWSEDTKSICVCICWYLYAHIQILSIGWMYVCVHECMYIYIWESTTTCIFVLCVWLVKRIAYCMIVNLKACIQWI